jgi:hypothetical protein
MVNPYSDYVCASGVLEEGAYFVQGQFRSFSIETCLPGRLHLGWSPISLPAPLRW